MIFVYGGLFYCRTLYVTARRTAMSCGRNFTRRSPTKVLATSTLTATTNLFVQQNILSVLSIRYAH